MKEKTGNTHERQVQILQVYPRGRELAGVDHEIELGMQ